MTKSKLTKKTITLILAIVLVIVLLETYAHTYVEIGAVSAIPKKEVVLLWHTEDTGNYTFSYDNGQWIVRWLVGGTGPSNIPYSIYIYKLSQNSSLLDSEIGIKASGLSSEATEAFSLQMSPFSYSSEFVSAKGLLNSVSNETNSFTCQLKMQFYRQTAMGTFPDGQLTVQLTTYTKDFR